MKSGRFHVKSTRFRADFMKSSGFQVKSAGFHVDFMKSSRFQVKSGRFHMKSTYKTYKSNISRKTLQFYGVLWEGYVMFSHEIRRISKDQLPGMVSPMFYLLGRPCKATCEEVSAQCEVELSALPDQMTSFLNCEDLPAEQVMIILRCIC